MRRRSSNLVLKVLERIVHDPKAAPPIAQLIGFRPVSVSSGRAVVILDADRRFWNPMGTVHGGTLCDIADAAMGIAYASLLGPGETFTTLELKANFLRPIWEAELRATAHVLRKGRTVGLVECRVTDGKGLLVAYFTSTCLSLPGTSERPLERPRARTARGAPRSSPP